MKRRFAAVGDIVSQPELDTVNRLLRRIRKQYGIDFVIANGENACGVGITPNQAEDIFAWGVDVITLGNHVFHKRQIVPYLDDCRIFCVRPIRGTAEPGRGYGIYYCLGIPSAGNQFYLVQCGMKFGPDNPFLLVDRILREQKREVRSCSLRVSWQCNE